MIKTRTSANKKKSGTPRGVPLIVDFDGTLQLSDLNWEGVVWLVKIRPWACVALLWVLLKYGRGAMKLHLQAWASRWGWVPRVPIDPRVLALMEAARKEGREVKVATGSAEGLVRDVLRRAGLDYAVVGTTAAMRNLIRDEKAAALVALYGEGGFDYAGNSRDDLPVWRHARQAIVVNASAAVTVAAKKQGRVALVLPRQVPLARALWRAVRPHQWLKNLLVFIPLVSAHMWPSVMAWTYSAVAFVAFCLCASGIYLLNDLLDVQDDRAHATKRGRPFAAGTLPLLDGLVLAPLLAVLGVGIGLVVSPWLAAVLLAYVVLTMGYSWWFKHVPLADVAVLAALYGVRMVGGAAATGIPLSYWLGMFAFLVFYSLALLKRYVELRRHKGRAPVRGYYADDGHLVAAQGMGAGLLSVMVVGLYITSPDVTRLYATPGVLGVLCPLLVWGLARMWLLAHRGEMDDDPILFAARDPVTWVLGMVALAVVVLAAA